MNNIFDLNYQDNPFKVAGYPGYKPTAPISPLVIKGLFENYRFKDNIIQEDIDLFFEKLVQYENEYNIQISQGDTFQFGPLDIHNVDNFNLYTGEYIEPYHGNVQYDSDHGWTASGYEGATVYVSQPILPSVTLFGDFYIKALQVHPELGDITDLTELFTILEPYFIPFMHIFEPLLLKNDNTPYFIFITTGVSWFDAHIMTYDPDDSIWDLMHNQIFLEVMALGAMNIDEEASLQSNMILWYNFETEIQYLTLKDSEAVTLTDKPQPNTYYWIAG